jgi:hypothetical protein
VDRESLNIPPPPPNFRTPYEMFRVVTSTCDSAQPQLLNLQLSSSYDEILVYDRMFGTAQWRDASFHCGAPGCPSVMTARRFERSANIPLFGDAGGVQAVVAIALSQPDLRGTALQDLWWAGPAESGWGLNIAKSGEKLFISGFVYDAAGKPTWVMMSNGQWDDLHNVWYGDLYTPTGGRFGEYNPNLLHVGDPVGTASLSFNGPDTGHFDYTLKGASGGKAISRYVFGPRDVVPGKYTGLWWGGPEQNGWGVAVSQQGDTGFATWYTYDGEEQAIWFFMPAGKFTAPGTVSGELYRTTGARWAGSHYDGAATRVIPVGTLELRFPAGDKPGTMTAVVDGVTIVNPLFQFGF